MSATDQERPRLSPDQRKKLKQFQLHQRQKQLIVVGMLLIVAIGAGLGLWTIKTYANQPDSNRYQAVFLDNGQVFFGKLSGVNDTYAVLDNAFYSKKVDAPTDATAAQREVVENNVSLVKAGSEVYGPDETMKIRSDKILFWQNLRSDSKVTQAIKSN